MEIINSWSKDRGLVINPLKTQVIIFGSPHNLSQIEQMTLPRVHVNGQAVPFSDKVKNLGVIIDKDINWKWQVNSITKRVYGSLFSLYKAAGPLDVECKKMLIQTLVFPIFEYGNIVMVGLKQSQKHRLQVAQNACVRFVTHVPRFEHVTPFLRALEWLTISERQDLALLKIIYKALNGVAPSYIRDMVEVLGSRHERLVRSSRVLSIPIHKTDRIDRSFVVAGPRLWNSLPIAVRCAKNLVCFVEGAVAMVKDRL